MRKVALYMNRQQNMNKKDDTFVLHLLILVCYQVIDCFMICLSSSRESYTLEHSIPWQRWWCEWQKHEQGLEGCLGEAHAPQVAPSQSGRLTREKYETFVEWFLLPSQLSRVYNTYVFKGLKAIKNRVVVGYLTSAWIINPAGGCKEGRVAVVFMLETWQRLYSRIKHASRWHFLAFSISWVFPP